MRSDSVPKVSQKLDNFIFRIGNVTAWLNFLLLLIIILQICPSIHFRERLCVPGRIAMASICCRLHDSHFVCAM